MSHIIGTSKVVTALPLSSSDAGSEEILGAVVFGTIDIDSYPTGGEEINAKEIGLRKIFGCIMQVEELAGTPNNDFVSGCAVAADGLSMIVECQQDDGTSGVPAESADTTNIGICTFIAFGEGARQTENV